MFVYCWESNPGPPTWDAITLLLSGISTPFVNLLIGKEGLTKLPK